ncbi:biliverdin-producing heme oxygenase [Acidovorax sp. NCPPB 4044]|uniref:biliverdin-producing heme oxygenase n=1 Tax=Acidovorax sp. NCPPB 4044 TaxID=2940490 RepID=UPI002302BD20|nr:biliverdin-producing heme oxygenase [Acidovorax sp. NCPPB 4044]MDA8521303.1 biliverdin-producing heme oxygenase [Acidovorax sp. NCPPB 4044]
MPGTAAAGACLAALRQSTGQQHAQLDSGLPVGRDGATLHDYAFHAGALSAWLQALGPSLALGDGGLQALRIGMDTQRLQALRLDLEDAADTAWPEPCADTQATVAAAVARFPARQAAVAWGIAYVVEGSQLGGQWLYRRLVSPLAPHPLRYLQGSGPETGARWRKFLAGLDHRIRSPGDIDAACAGAQAAFEGLQRRYGPRSLAA